MCSRSNANAALLKKGTGCKGAYPFLDLPHHDSIQQTVPDAMHTVKDAVVNIYDLITGKDDTDKCRNSEYKLGRLPIETLRKTISRKDPMVTYSLSSSELELANHRASSIITPVHIDFTSGMIFSSTAALKSHDWKQVHILVLYA